MKKIVPILLICLILCGCTDQSKNYCHSIDCFNQQSYNSLYCREHTCTQDGCKEFKYSSDEFCAKHKGITIKEDIKLTEAQLTKCRTVVDEYCKKLMDTQSNIQAIYVPDDEPETSVLYIMYKCFVTRGDDMDIATIYVEMSNDETFEVYKMEYDK